MSDTSNTDSSNVGSFQSVGNAGQGHRVAGLVAALTLLSWSGLVQMHCPHWATMLPSSLLGVTDTQKGGGAGMRAVFVLNASDSMMHVPW